MTFIDAEYQAKMDTKISSKVLYEMLRIKRPHLGMGVDLFISKFLSDIKGAQSRTTDLFGNIIVGVGCDVSLTHFDSLPKVMFSAHIDTVHREDGAQNICIEAGSIEFISLADKNSHCLGADDGAGVWVMLNMIANGVEGVYIFHQGEEKGCLGSSYLAEYHPDFIEHFEQCISIDRKGTDSIITHQMSGRCCSDAYALELADMLMMGHAPDDTGVVTDSDSYSHLIQECTNISAGYYSEHTVKEHVNVTYLKYLVAAMSAVDWTNLVIVREAGDDAYPNWQSDKYAFKDEYNDWTCEYTGRGLAFYTDLVYNDPKTAVELLVELTR